MTQSGPRIRIISEESVIADLEQVLRKEQLPVLSSGAVESPGKLALDFGTVSSVVTVASTLFFSGPIVPTLLRLLRKKSKHRVIIDGPRKRVEIKWRPDLTEEDIRKALHEAATIDS